VPALLDVCSVLPAAWPGPQRRKGRHFSQKPRAPIRLFQPGPAFGNRSRRCRHSTSSLAGVGVAATKIHGGGTVKSGPKWRIGGGKERNRPSSLLRTVGKRRATVGGGYGTGDVAERYAASGREGCFESAADICGVNVSLIDTTRTFRRNIFFAADILL
jgi:hypothetical protein